MQNKAAAKVDVAMGAAIDRSTDRQVDQSVATGSLRLLRQRQITKLLQRLGRVAEWFKAAVLKTAVGATPPWVRIPPLPPDIIYKPLI